MRIKHPIKSAETDRVVFVCRRKKKKKKNRAVVISWSC